MAAVSIKRSIIIAIMANYIPCFNFVYKLPCFLGFLWQKNRTKSLSIKFG